MIKIEDPKSLNIPSCKDGYEIYLLSLSEFPHGDLDGINRNGKNGEILFYNVGDTEVLSFNEDLNTLEWKQPTFYSVHPKRKLIIVTLKNGFQIFTDDDPRAIYGLNPATGEYERATPSKALELGLQIPTYGFHSVKTKHNLSADDFEFPIISSDLEEILEAQSCFFTIGIKSLVSFDKESKKFLLESCDNDLDESKDIKFTEIDKIDDTGVEIDGYDLTVPGTDTFVASSGVVLSNTMNVHVPALAEAQKEIREKLLPSKQIFSPRDYRVINPLKQDYVLGANSQVNAPAVNKWIVKNKEELLQGIRSGKIKYSDEVVVLDNK